MRLIDADALGIGRCDPNVFPVANRGYCAGWNGVINLIEEAPTINPESLGVKGEWISVKDRLPEGDKVVLCYKADRGIRLGKLLDATYADGVQAFMDCERKYAFGATHWMSLPQPPKGE